MGREAPRSVGEQIDRLTAGLRTVLQDRLHALYLHGSLVLGCFNPRQSDVDVLVVVERPLPLDDKLRLVDLLLDVSNSPHPIELDAVTVAQLENWRHPSPYELHYSEWSRDRLTEDPLRRLAELPATNADLAAHITVTRAAGTAVVGPPPHELLPDVPFTDYRDSVVRDIEWARTVDSETYGMLSPCRVWATLATGEVHSKATGARWALARLPDDLRPPVAAALAGYLGDDPVHVPEPLHRRLVDYVVGQLPQ